MPDEGLMTCFRGECPGETGFSVTEKWKVLSDGGRALGLSFPGGLDYRSGPGQSWFEASGL